ncbi:MAG: M56 family metallopeptidase [Kiritimatiellae bacterium]|nr:M56 family metallopeptidase [Kiritimatiellia bacterium]
MHAIINHAEGLLGWVVQASGQAAVLVCLILLVQVLFRKKLSPAWRYGLWLLVVVRLALPATIESAASVFNLARTPAAQRIAAVVSPMEPVEIAQAAGSPGQAAPQPAEIEPGTPAASGAAWSLRQGLVDIWVAVVLLLLARIIYKNYRFSSFVVRRRPVTDEAVLNLLQDCKAEMNVHVPMDVIETPKVDSPALLGFVRPRLLLPPDMLKSFPRDKLRYFFLHELAHFKRGDIFVNWLASLLHVFHWFNPFVWLAFSRMRADREAACDAYVMALCGDAQEGRRYGEAIVDLMEFAARVHWLPGVVGILEEEKEMERRIAMIANARKYSPWSKALAAGLIAVLGLVTLTNAPSQAAQTPVGPQPDALREYLADLNLDFEEGPAPGQAWPAVWGGGGAGYEFAADGEIKHGGKWSGRIRCASQGQGGFGTLTGFLDPAHFAGKRIRYSGWMKLEDVSGFAGLWFRADVGGKSPAFDNMQKKNIRRTKDWKEYSIELAIPKDTDNINFGALVAGSGTLWVDDLKIEIIGKAAGSARAGPRSAISRRVYTVPSAVAAQLEYLETAADVQEFFKVRGVDFPAGASISYEPGTRRLTVLNTLANMDHIGALMEQMVASRENEGETHAERAIYRMFLDPPPSLAGKLKAGDVTARFAKYGVPFPPGASVHYDPMSDKIVVSNTTEHIESLRLALEKENP